MGLGDHVIVTGEVERRLKEDPRPKLIAHGQHTSATWQGQAYWHDIWRGNPHILRKAHGDYEVLHLGKGARPYIDYEKRTPYQLAYRDDWKVTPGRLYIEDPSPVGDELYAVVEPHAKRKNKRWGAVNYQAVIDAIPGVTWVEVGNESRLKRTQHFRTPKPLDALPIMRGAAFYLGPEGFLHHVAAAYGRRAVVLFGGVSPISLSYPFHLSVHTPEPACGMLADCPHCQKVWRALRPGAIIELVERVLSSYLHRVRPEGGDISLRAGA